MEMQKRSSGGARALVAFVASVLHLGCAQSGSAGRSPTPIESHSFVNRDGLIQVTARIGASEPLDFLLDTGASPCVVDSSAASRMGVASIPSSRERQGGAGTFRSRVTAQPLSLRLGDATLRCHEAIVLDLSGLTAVVGHPLSGIVGGDFFHGRLVRIDYDRSVISVYNRGGYEPDSSTRIPIRLAGNRVYLSAILSVPGGPRRVTRELLIDTGSRDNVDDRLLESSQPVGQVDATGLGSGGKAIVGKFTEVRIGSHVFRDVPGVSGNVSLIGMGVLGKFNLVFDYDGGWLGMEKRAH